MNSNRLDTMTVWILILVKQKIRKGIPDHLRGYVWQALAETKSFWKEGVYHQLIREKVNEKDRAVKDIIRDLNRTSPNNTFFKEKFGLGQRSLFNVLRAISSYYRETGYVQGMGFLAACFLNFMDEESAFWLLYSIIKHYGMSGFYKPDFPELNKSFYKLLSLLKKHCEKLYYHLKKTEVIPSMYATQWFITLFFYNNTMYDIIVRIFDVYLLEKDKTIYRFAIALMKINEEKILNKKQFEDIMACFKFIDENIDIDKLFYTAFNISIPNKTLEELDLKYEENKNNLNDEIMEQCKRDPF